MRILVTGGAGYIGSVTVEHLLDLRHDVVVLDNLWRGHRRAVPESATFVHCDLRDGVRTSSVVAGAAPDAVLHFAAATLVPESVVDPGSYFGINVVGSHNLLEAMRAAGTTSIVFSSTAAVYGMAESVPVPDTSPMHPINPYGR